MPSNIEVGRGFIVNNEGCSRQIDILLTDNTYPVLFRDGDLVFVTPDAVRGIIEVKTRASSNNISTAFENLTFNARFARNRQSFIGFFAYESELQERTILEKLKVHANGNENNVIDHVCIGPDQFYKFWRSSPLRPEDVINRWHFYRFPRKLGPAFFINNLINVCSNGKLDHNTDLWFRVSPDNSQTKEMYLADQIALNSFDV